MDSNSFAGAVLLHPNMAVISLARARGRDFGLEAARYRAAYLWKPSSQPTCSAAIWRTLARLKRERGGSLAAPSERA